MLSKERPSLMLRRTRAPDPGAAQRAPEGSWAASAAGLAGGRQIGTGILELIRGARARVWAG